MAAFRPPKRNEEADLREAFVADDVRGELLLGGEVFVTPAVSTGRLYQQILSDQLDWTGLTSGARRTVMEIERSLSVVDFGTAIAAADSGPVERRYRGYSITFRASQSDPNLTYLLISGASMTTDSPGNLIVFGMDDRRISLPLPLSRRGVIQVLIDNSSELYDLLSEPASVLILR